MSGVRRWNLFLRAVMIAVGITVVGIWAFRIGVIEDDRLALWPTLTLLRLDRLHADQPLIDLAVPAAVQIAVWTLLAYVVFSVFDAVSRGSGRRP